MSQSRRPPSKQVQELQVELWNAKHLVGTEVTVRLDNGTEKQTKTTTPAQMLSGHTAVIWLEGISECYLLSRVKAVPA